METATILGIDEAGYGPMLGPLVVSAVAFDVPESVLREAEDPDGPNLWALLKSAVLKRPSRRGSRLAVADSKILYNAANSEHGLKLLERAALTFLMQNGEMPATLNAILDRICPHVWEEMDGYPWYRRADLGLPVRCPCDDLATQRNALKLAMSRAGVTFRGAWVEVLPEGRFNRLVTATHNKAVVLFSQATRLIQRAADALGPVPLRVWVDRQGGRVCYREALMTAFDGARVDVLEESPERSSYRLHRPHGPWMIRFVMKGESHQLPIALASIYSKYIRELFMICFNRYWSARVSDLRPTAGYYVDARRFMEEIRVAIDEHQVDRSTLVRMA